MAPAYLLLGAPLFYRTLRRHQPEFGRLILMGLLANTAACLLLVPLLSWYVAGRDMLFDIEVALGIFVVLSGAVLVLTLLFVLLYGRTPQELDMEEGEARF